MIVSWENFASRAPCARSARKCVSLLHRALLIGHFEAYNAKKNVDNHRKLTFPKGTVYKPRRQRRGRGVVKMSMFVYEGEGEGQGSVYVDKTHISFREY